ncbi:MAG: hypothetical protein KFF73_12150, partial [Cyclobacteriaceae bacterium]|nr:hypothetical protein [Cyclobacteriaceae bacterium]
MKIRYKYLFISFLLLIAGVLIHYLYVNHIQRQEIYAGRISKKIQRSLYQVKNDRERILEYIEDSDTLMFTDLNELA